MHWESQKGRFPRDPRLGHRPGCSYSPQSDDVSPLKELVTTKDSFVSLDSSSFHTIDITKKLVVITGGSVAMDGDKWTITANCTGYTELPTYLLTIIA